MNPKYLLPLAINVVLLATGSHATLDALTGILGAGTGAVTGAAGAVTGTAAATTGALGGLLLNNGALTLPLLGAAGTGIAGPLAVLGLLKLGAALLIGGGYLALGHHDDYYYHDYGYHDYGGYHDYDDYGGHGKGGFGGGKGGHGHGKGGFGGGKGGHSKGGFGGGKGHGRRRRDAVSEEQAQSAYLPDPDALFLLISSMDTYQCGKQLVCELEAKNPTKLEKDEELIVRLFSNRKNKKTTVNPASAKAEYDLAAELGMATKDQVLCRARYPNCPYSAEDMMKALRSSKL